MNASEYVAKALEDKKYLEGIVGQLPDSLVAAINNSDNSVDVGTASKLMSLILGTVAPSMGVQASEQEIEDECRSQCPESGFAAVRVLVRAGRMITKEARKRKLA